MPLVHANCNDISMGALESAVFSLSSRVTWRSSNRAGHSTVDPGTAIMKQHRRRCTDREEEEAKLSTDSQVTATQSRHCKCYAMMLLLPVGLLRKEVVNSRLSKVASAALAQDKETVNSNEMH